MKPLMILLALASLVLQMLVHEAATCLSIEPKLVLQLVQIFFLRQIVVTLMFLLYKEE